MLQLCQVRRRDCIVYNLSENGNVYTWGYGRNGGGLGLGNTIGDTVAPQVVTRLDGKQVQFISCGHNITAVITSSGELWIMGTISGRGGDGFPWKAPGFDGKKVDYVSVGFKHLMVVAGNKLYFMLLITFDRWKCICLGCVNGWCFRTSKY
jgi:hypothetical protein